MVQNVNLKALKTEFTFPNNYFVLPAHFYSWFIILFKDHVSLCPEPAGYDSSDHKLKT